jgi:hypothetical protein
MIKTRIALSVAALALPLASGCGGDDDGGGWDGFIAQSSITADIQCECFAENGFASEAECISETFNPPGGAELECLEAAFALDSTGPATLSCLTNTVSTLNSCLEANQDCADPSATEECESDAFGGLLACAQMASEEVNAAADACDEE